MSILYNNKSGSTPETILLAGNANTDQILNGTSKNAIANKAVYNALQDKIDKAVQDLVYYYTKSDVYNKAETRALLSTISSLDIKVVNSLPVSDISTTTIYFLKPTGSQNYDEYVYVDNAWVKIGDTGVDLSQYLEIDDFNVAIADYYTSAEVDALINSYYTKSQVDTLLAGKQDPLTFDNAPTAGSNNPVTSTGINTALGTKAGTDKAFMPRGRATETDMDDLLVVGSHVINPEVTVDNVPEENQWGLVEVFQQGEDISTSSVVQVWYGTNGQNYSRFRGGSPLVWSNWKGFGGTQALYLNSHEIVADDPNVIDTDTLVEYIYLNYAAIAPNRNQFYRVWVTSKTDDSRYTPLGGFLREVYKQHAGYDVSFFEFIAMRKGGNFLECQLKPWANTCPSMYITYWNSSGGWASNRLLDNHSNWYCENGYATYRLTEEDLNNVNAAGHYWQYSSANCTSARHYPCGINGELEVLRPSSTTVVQKYRPSSSSDYTTTFIRRFYNGAWEAWSSTDYCHFVQVNSQSVTASGITVNIPWSTAGRCRELACKFYGFQLVNYWIYGAQTYKSVTFLGPNGNRIRLYWANDSATTCTLCLLDSNNNPTAGTIPQLNFYGKLGTAYPSIYM